jgi:hypothetical protein
MKSRPSRSKRPQSLALPLTVLAAALLASLAAGWKGARFWLRLPPVRNVPAFHDLFLNGELDELEAAFDRINRSISAEAREAFALRLASNTLTGALTGRVEASQLEPTIGQAVGKLTKSQLGRLQQAAARMWLLEQAGEPVEQWWPALRVFLEGMERANLAHYEQALTLHWARAYEAAGRGPGTAYLLAEDLVGQPHGPLLEFSVARLRRVIEDRAQAGDVAAANTCRELLYHWLRQWVLEPGPAGLRLLAANLLASMLANDPVTASSAPMQALTESLRSWRQAYREAVKCRPVGIMAPYPGSLLAPAADERLFVRFALSIWLAAATLVGGITALALVWTWLGHGRSSAGRRPTMSAVIAGLVVVVAGLAWLWLRPDSVREDLRGDFSRLTYWWRFPFVGAGLTLLLLLGAGILRRSPPGGKSRYVARLGSVAARTWLVLAVALLGTLVAGELARRDFERATRAACDDTIAARIGADGEALLVDLRRWEP